MDTSRTC